MSSWKILPPSPPIYIHKKTGIYLAQQCSSFWKQKRNIITPDLWTMPVHYAALRQFARLHTSNGIDSRQFQVVHSARQSALYMPSFMVVQSIQHSLKSGPMSHTERVCSGCPILPTPIQLHDCKFPILSITPVIAYSNHTNKLRFIWLLKLWYAPYYCMYRLYNLHFCMSRKLIKFYHRIEWMEKCPDKTKPLQPPNQFLASATQVWFFLVYRCIWGERLCHHEISWVFRVVSQEAYSLCCGQ